MPHIHEKIDFTATALIVHNNTVLLRKHDKYNILLGPGGHIELDEDPNQAVLREIKEEVGLDATLVGTPLAFNNLPDEKDLIPPRFLNRHRINPTHEHIDMIYLATVEDDRITQGENEKSNEVRWFSKQELLDPQLAIKESIRHYALKALEELSR
jgi:8-oxo-dGTP diphosphatase